MAIVRTDNKYYTEIAEALREHGYSGQTFKPSEMASLIGNACGGNYQAGKEVGYAECNGDFWENILKGNGEYMFAGKGWNENTFKPPSGTVIRPTYPYMMFGSTGIEDLADLCGGHGTTLDFSRASTLQYVFYNGTESKITHVGVLDTTGTSKLILTFYATKHLHTIDKIILKADGSQTFSSFIHQCTALRNITIEGKIGQNGFDVSGSTQLTDDSLGQILNALYDYSGTSTTKTVTLGASNLSRLPESLLAEATQKGWSLV